MSKEYQYKRYQLNLDPEDAKQMQIIDYLESHKAGKNRNEALIKVILAGFGEKIELDLSLSNPVQIMTEQRLKKMDCKLDKILCSLLNQPEQKEVEYQEEPEEKVEKVIYTEPVRDGIIDEKTGMYSIASEQNTELQEQNIQEDEVDVLIPSGIMDFINGL